MKNILFFILIFFVSFATYAQELEADDFVIINQTDAAYPGFNAKTYRGLFPVGHGQFKMFNYGGTPGNLTALGANETLGSFVFNGYDGSQNVISAVIQAKTITDSRDPRFNFLLSNGIGNQRPNRMTIIGQSGHVGIGITDPTEKLDVNGNIRMRQGATLGYILVSDADGKMTWTDPSTIMTAGDTDWLTDGDGELYRIDGAYMGEGIDSPDGHRLNVQNNELGKAAVRGVNQTPSGLTLFCEGQLALQNYATNPAGLPLDVNNIGVFGKVYPIGEDGAAIYGWNNGIQTDNYSGLFIADGVAISGTNYGLYASAQNGLNNWAGYFDQGDVHVNDNVRIGTTNTSPYKFLLNAGNEIEVMKATGTNVFGSYFTLENESTGGIPWNLISTGQFNGEGAGKLLFHTSSAIGSSATMMTLEREGHLGIGTIDPISKLHVVDDTLNAASKTVFAISDRNTNSISVMEAAYIQTGNFDGTAIQSFAGAVNGYGYGMRTEAGFVGMYAQTYGGDFDDPLSLFGSFSRCTGSAGLRKGVYGRAENTGGDAYGGDFVGEAGSTGKTAYGIKGYANHFEQGLSYGVYADHDGGDTGYSLYINGQGFATSGGVLASDERFKKDIKEVKGALDIINDLQPKTYSFRQDGEFAKLNFDDKLQYGFIAQELEEVLPNAVHDVDVVFTDPERQAELSNPENKGKKIKDNTYTKEYKGVNYTALIPVLTQGIKELSATVEEKEEVIEKMETKMDAMAKQMDEMATLLESMNSKFNQMEEDMSSCCLSGTDNRTGSVNTNVELNGSDVPALEQNNPNPFYEQTIIKYYIPFAARTARMTITDLKGSPIKSVNLAGTGLGTVTIDANELPVGTYIYTLFVDDKQVESKQMMLIK